MSARTWLITGAGRGLGRAFADEVLATGGRVVATARKPAELEHDLAHYGDRALVLPLDVSDSGRVRDVVARAIDVMGTLDVVVNNAGYGLGGAVEEVSEAEARDQLDTNFFGPLWVTQAVLPHLRERGRGHIIQISSMVGIAPRSNVGLYSASKAALEAMSDALAAEVAPFGIKVTIVEPSGFRTDWRESMEHASPLPAYQEVLAARRQPIADRPVPPGDPALAARVLIDIVENPNPPQRLPLGNMAYDVAIEAYRERLAEFAAWEAVSRSVDVPAA